MQRHSSHSEDLSRSSVGDKLEYPGLLTNRASALTQVPSRSPSHRHVSSCPQGGSRNNRNCLRVWWGQPAMWVCQHTPSPQPLLWPRPHPL